MGTKEPESKNKKISVMESGNGSGTSSTDTKKNQTATPTQVTPAKEVNSPLSSPGKDLKLDSDETSKTITDATEPITHKKDTPLVSELNEEDCPVISMPRDERTSDVLSITDDAAIAFPPTQMMERADDSNSPDPNRIPSHVFARTKSTAPVEWSVASNESLFSIHMGNTSFTKDHVGWFSKSGELGQIGDSQFSGPLVDISNVPGPTPSNKSTDLGMKSGNLSQGLGATEAAAAETMREVIRENAADNNGEEKLPPPKQEPRRHYKNSDDSSIKSFAFPILTGDVDKNGSLNAGNEKKKKQQSSQPSTPKATEQTEPQTPKQQTPKATQNAAQASWFSCFPCCPMCS